VSAAVSHDGNCLLVSSLDGLVRLLDKEDGQLLSSYKGHKNKEYRIEAALAYTDEYVMSGSEDGQLYAWELVDGALLHVVPAHKSALCTLSMHPSEHMLVTGAADGSVTVWLPPGAGDAPGSGSAEVVGGGRLTGS
jgi:mitogen-activated protein kinase organizer 1